MYQSRDTSLKSTLIVLAGGRGVRLGGLAKGLIRLANGETVVERLLRLTEGPAFVSTNHPEWYERLEVPLIADVVPDKGAPGGVVTGLAVALTPWVLIVACDMPFVTPEMVFELHERRHAGADAVCFTRGGQLEPLVGLYRRELCFDWAPRLDGNPSMRELVNCVRLDTLEAQEPARLISLNSPDDFRRAAAHAAESFSEPGVAGTLCAQAPTW